MAAVGAGAVTLGLADYLLAGRSVGTSGSVTSSSASGYSPNFPDLPDYEQFLAWLNSVSKPYSGKTVNITMEDEFTPLSLQLIDSDFNMATGINDSYSIKPYSLQLSDVSLMFSTKSPTYDVFGLDNQNLGAFTGDSLSPIELAKMYPEITYSGLDYSDFDQFMFDYVSTYPPNVNQVAQTPTAENTPVLPLDTPTMIQVYRADIYSKLGLTPAQTWDEYFSNLQALQKSGITPFAAVSEASPDISIVYEFLNHVASFGGSLWAVDGDTITPTLTDDPVVAALENYVRFEPYADSGSTAYTWDDVFNSLAHGVSATALLFNGYASWINDPARSVAAGSFAFARNPAGPEGSFSAFGGAGVGVSKYSPNPEIAWLYMQWATARGTAERMALAQYHVYPTHPSALEVPAVMEALQTSALQACEVTNEVFQTNSAAALIGFPLWFDALQALSYHLNLAWSGSESPSQALANAQQAIEKLGTLSF